MTVTTGPRRNSVAVRRVGYTVAASLIAGLAVNLVYLAHDPRWLRSAGDLVTAGFGLAVFTSVTLAWRVGPLETDPVG